ncbi:hypothetical protein E2C01_068502 [Portunus trituberculatus]|uniref:Uncharacterized protein n=1 Tax=Portunus trituberculatus TaxID=210409 RepID=A0A5B7HS56_PORTR|nr:hypothetical protein [Portunus trituberculatus]
MKSYGGQASCRGEVRVSLEVVKSRAKCSTAWQSCGRPEREAKLEWIAVPPRGPASLLLRLLPRLVQGQQLPGKLFGYTFRNERVRRDGGIQAVPRSSLDTTARQ